MTDPAQTDPVNSTPHDDAAARDDAPAGFAPTTLRGRPFATRVGRVVRLFTEGGYGFIKTATGRVIYFAADDCACGTLAGLLVGMRVRFELEGHGLPRAQRVTPA